MQAEARGKMKLIRFAPNRVGRVYAGGAEIDRLQGVEAPADGGCPEEWIASTVEAQGPRRPGEGVSRVLLPDGGSVPFDRLLGEEAEEILGPAHVARFGKAPGVLTKLLDSAIRLPVQAHPDRAAAKRLFGSEYGKTEAWIVIGGRKIDGEEPYLLMGFNESFDYEVFRREALAGVMERTVGMMHRCPVVPGEVYLITGGLPHAIGSGVFVQEIMEPTDYVVQPELHCGGTRLDERARWGGLDPEKALGVFHCEALPEAELLRRVRRTPVVLSESSGTVLRQLLDRGETGFFGSLELRLDGGWTRPEELGCFMAGTVLGGTAVVAAGRERLALAPGQTFALAASARPVFEGKAEILFALPPALHLRE